MKRNRFCLLSILILTISLITHTVCSADNETCAFATQKHLVELCPSRSGKISKDYYPEKFNRYLSGRTHFVSSRVKDISDRSYEEAVIQLLDNAQNSIVISMYSISLGTETNNPVRLLLNDLLEAMSSGDRTLNY